MRDWEERVAEAWASIDDHENREDEFRALIDSLAAELPDGDPIAAFERACTWDSTGHSDRAVPLYQWALDHGLTGYRRRRAVIQIVQLTAEHREGRNGSHVAGGGTRHRPGDPGRADTDPR